MSHLNLIQICYRLAAPARIILVLLLVLGATPATPARADTSVCGPIASNTTWTPANNNYIVTCDIIVNAGVTLTIQSGVVVRFDPGTSLQVNGTLVATGATFTSNHTTPTKGDWGRIYFTSTSVDAQFDANGNYVSGSKIDSSLVEWGGGYIGSDIKGAIHTETASPFIIQNTIRNNYRGILAVGKSAVVPLIIKQNLINNNEAPMYSYGAGINVALATVISNTITSNHTTWVGGILATSSTIVGNHISGNSDYGGDGVAGIQAVDSRIENNLVSNNTSGFCGGIRALGNSEIISNTIRDNSGRTGGVIVDSGIVSGNMIFGNTGGGDGGGLLANNATIRNNVIHGNTALSGGGIHAHSSNLTGNTIFDNSATSKGGGIFLWEDFTATDNTITGNSAADGGGVYLESVWGLGSFTGNRIEGNHANKGGGVYAVTTTLRGNTILNNTATSDGGGIYASDSVIANNTITSNTVPSFGHGSGAYLKAVTDFSYNDVLTNTAPSGTAGGISIEGLTEFHYNNLYGNMPYDAEVVSSLEVSATLNYWGLLPCLSIPAHIYDGHDAPGRGNLTYAPSLYLPVPVAQLATPSNLTLTTTASGVTLSWTPLPPIPDVGCRVPGAPGPDLVYRVYYDTDSACAPFDGIGLPSGPSPINAGAASQIVLPGASPQGIVFTVTAYDYLGRESSYSNLVGSLLQGRDIYLPVVVR